MASFVLRDIRKYRCCQCNSRCDLPTLSLTHYKPSSRGSCAHMLCGECEVLDEVQEFELSTVPETHSVGDGFVHVNFSTLTRPESWNNDEPSYDADEEDNPQEEKMNLEEERRSLDEARQRSEEWERKRSEQEKERRSSPVTKFNWDTLPPTQRTKKRPLNDDDFESEDAKRFCSHAQKPIKLAWRNRDAGQRTEKNVADFVEVGKNVRPETWVGIAPTWGFEGTEMDES